MAADSNASEDEARDAPAAAEAPAPAGERDAQAEVLASDAELEEIKEHSRRKTLGIRAASAIALIALGIGIYLGLGERGLDLLIAGIAAICFLEFIFLVVKATANVPYRLAAILTGAVYIGLAAIILIDFTLQYFAMALGVVILADVFAYAVGTLVGGPKILPRVSPNKTWAGLFGGLFGGFLALTPLVYVSWASTGAFDTQVLLVAAIGGPLLAFVAMAGDLFESWLKRKAGVKDSSRLIPGHGGFLDRFDGVIPVAIVIGAILSVA